jgi:hypothetical protein
VLEKVCDFSDLWGYICEGRPFAINLGFFEWCSSGYSMLYLLSQSDHCVSWEIVALCDL